MVKIQHVLGKPLANCTHGHFLMRTFKGQRFNTVSLLPRSNPHSSVLGCLFFHWPIGWWGLAMKQDTAKPDVRHSTEWDSQNDRRNGLFVYIIMCHYCTSLARAERDVCYYYHQCWRSILSITIIRPFYMCLSMYENKKLDLQTAERR